MTELPPSKTVKFQERVYGPVQFRDTAKTIKATVRWDDRCGNGYNDFSVTGEIGRDWCGCIHDEILEHFPELRESISFHLVSAKGPLHYVANTLWHVQGRDHRGLLKGETRQLQNRSGAPVWKIVVRDEAGEVVEPRHWLDSVESLVPKLTAAYEPILQTGEGQPIDFDAARLAACWPEATDEELAAPDLEARLLARLPELMAKFHAVVLSHGFEW